MFSKKRGLSDVVTVTLIILLAIAAVVIVWAFVRSTLEDVGEEITGACITSAITLVSCNSAAGTAVVRNDGRQDTIDSVKLVYYETVAADSNAQTRDTIGCTAMSPLAQATCSPIDPDGGVGPLSAIPVPPPIRVGAAAVIGTTTCPVSESVICT